MSDNQRNQTNLRRKPYNNIGKHLRLGVIVYFLILAYLIFIVISFTVTQKTSYTLAEPGKLIESDVFAGMIIRDESVVNSQISGNIHYFVSEGEKVKVGTLVGIVDTNGEITEALNQQMFNLQSAGSNGLSATKMQSQLLQEKIRNYVISKDHRDFSYTYDVKKTMQKAVSDVYGTILLSRSQITEDAINQLISQSKASDNHFYYAPHSGVVSYHLDGLEYVTVDTFSPELLNNAVKVTDVLDNNKTSQNGEIFKIVKNSKWYLAAEINEVCLKFLEGKKYITLFIGQQGKSVTAEMVQIFNDGENSFAIFSIDRYINDYLDQRYIQFTIEYNHWEGIKIPTSSVATKAFVEVPTKAINKNTEIMKKVKSSESVAGETIVSIPLSMYYKKGDIAYVPVSDGLNIGDTILYGTENGENITYTIVNEIDLEGVYVINKGYAAFKIIETLASVKDYKIISDTTPYGVKIYDRIATEAAQLKENQILK